jgi:hypothetical protein
MIPTPVIVLDNEYKIKSYNKEDRTFAFESSDLDFSARFWNGLNPKVTDRIEILNPITGVSKAFEFVETMWMGSKEDREVGGWEYFNKDLKVNLIIFND